MSLFKEPFNFHCYPALTTFGQKIRRNLEVMTFELFGFKDTAALSEYRFSLKPFVIDHVFSIGIRIR